MAEKRGFYEFETDDIEDDNQEMEILMNKLKTKNEDLYEKTNYLIMNTSYVKRLLSPEWRHHYGKHRSIPNIIGVDARNDHGYNGTAPDPQSYYRRGTNAQYILDQLLHKTSGCILYDCRQTDIRKAINDIFSLEFCGGLYESALMNITWYQLDNNTIAVIEIDTESG